MEHAKPTLVVSRCLGFEACRYDGVRLASPFLDRLGRHAKLVTVCPEVALGLGIPRDPVRIVAGDREEDRLVQPATGLDLTERMVDFRERFLERLAAVDGFVLKARSPSCAVRDAKVNRGPERGSPTLRRGPGVFAAGVLRHFPGAAVEDEGRLSNFRIREHFLTRVFTLAEFRRVRARPTVRELVRFQARNKLLLMAANQTRMRELGRLVADAARRPARELVAEYGDALAKALERAPRFTSHVNVLMHALGHFKKGLSLREKAHFLDALTGYREGRVPLSALTAILSSWIARFEVVPLAGQSYFEPFPRGLVEITDPGKGRSD